MCEVLCIVGYPKWANSGGQTAWQDVCTGLQNCQNATKGGPWCKTSFELRVRRWQSAEGVGMGLLAPSSRQNGTISDVPSQVAFRKRTSRTCACTMGRVVTNGGSNDAFPRAGYSGGLRGAMRAMAEYKAACTDLQQ